jgi:hypothetical protein
MANRDTFTCKRRSFVHVLPLCWVAHDLIREPPPTARQLMCESFGMCFDYMPPISVGKVLSAGVIHRYTPAGRSIPGLEPTDLGSSLSLGGRSCAGSGLGMAVGAAMELAGDYAST